MKADVPGVKKDQIKVSSLMGAVPAYQPISCNTCMNYHASDLRHNPGCRPSPFITPAPPALAYMEGPRSAVLQLMQA